MELLGVISAAEWSSNSTTRTGWPVLDPDHLHSLGVSYERLGFDGVVVGHGFPEHDSSLVADQILSVTARLRVIVSHTVGLVSPTVAARQFATLDAIHPGRVGLSLFYGAAGDRAQIEEYLQVLEQEWSSERRFSFVGQFYRVDDAWSSLRPPGGRLPLTLPAGRDADREIAIRHGDVISLGALARQKVAGAVRCLRESAAAAGRGRPRLSVDRRLYAAATEEEAHAQARADAAIDDDLALVPALVGSYDRVAERLGELQHDGIDQVVVPERNLYTKAAQLHELFRRLKSVGRGSLVTDCAAD